MANRGPIRESRIDVETMILNNPQMDKIRDELQQTVQQAHKEMAENTPEGDDEEFVSRPELLGRKPGKRVGSNFQRGPLRNRMMADDAEARIRAVEEYEEEDLPRRKIISNRPEMYDTGDENDDADAEGMPPPPMRLPQRKTLRDQNRPQPAPTPSNNQKIQKQMEELRAQIEDLQRAKGINPPQSELITSPRLIVKTPKRNPKFTRLELPSNFVFYNFTSDECAIRKINITDQINITTAKLTGNLALLLDTLNNTISDEIDIRDLTVPDLYYVFYWHKFNSYPKVPLNVNWTSKYGNRNIYAIEETILEYKTPDITKEEYDELYYSRGLCLPTVRDWELIALGELSNEDLAIFEKAQYFVGQPDANGKITIQSKVDGMMEASGDDLELLQLIPEMREKTQHGVRDTIQLVDAQFNAEEHMEGLRYQALLLQAEAEKNREDDLLLFTQLTAEADSILEQVAEKEKILAEGGQVEAELETVPVFVNPLDFFPAL